jgi:hypothetical protein
MCVRVSREMVRRREKKKREILLFLEISKKGFWQLPPT